MATRRHTVDDEIKLTKREERAIARLQKLANTWPKSLMLFCNGGAIAVLKVPNGDGEPNRDYEVDVIYGIPNDGGDY